MIAPDMPICTDNNAAKTSTLGSIWVEHNARLTPSWPAAEEGECAGIVFTKPSSTNQVFVGDRDRETRINMIVLI